MVDGVIEEFLFLFVIISIRILLLYLLNYISHFLMAFLDKYISPIYYHYAIILFGQVGLAYLIIQ
jgi:hypothetical protein